MAEKGETPVKRKYSQRKRNKIKYEEFEMSMEEKPKSQKNSDPSEEEEQKLEDNELEETNIEKISEYEKLRLKNLEENRRRMLELGLIDKKKEKKMRLATKLLKPKTSKQKEPCKPKTSKPKAPRKSKKVEPKLHLNLQVVQKTPVGKIRCLDLFTESPVESPLVDGKTRIKEETLPMNENEGNSDFLERLRASLSEDLASSSLDSADSLIEDMQNLKFATVGRATSSRIQSMCVHPIESKLLVIAGSMRGELGLWNVSDAEVAQFTPHLQPLNCVSVCTADNNKLFTTSFDGTVRRADINKSVFNLVYQTDKERNMCYVTWHSQVDLNTLIIAHGTGEAGVVDIRTKDSAQQWFNCHDHAIRTIQIHPTQPYYFITASGNGECKIWDLRESKKSIDDFVVQVFVSKNGKGLTSSFFSPDGNKVVSTCNDDFIHVHDTSDLANSKELHKTMHDNHTGRSLSAMKAIWHPYISDLFFIGSLLQPHRIQLYSGSGCLITDIKDDRLTSVVPVVAIHPSMPVIVGGNSAGKAHVFTTPQLLTRYTKTDDGDNADSTNDEQDSF